MTVHITPRRSEWGHAGPCCHTGVPCIDGQTACSAGGRGVFLLHCVSQNWSFHLNCILVGISMRLQLLNVVCCVVSAVCGSHRLFSEKITRKSRFSLVYDEQRPLGTGQYSLSALSRQPCNCEHGPALRSALSQVKSIAEMGAYVSLLEYDNKEGMILLSELSRR